MWPWQKSEYQKWAGRVPLSGGRRQLGLPALDPRSQQLYGQVLPRGVLMPRLVADRPPLNYWMEAHQLAAMRWAPGQIMLGKMGNNFIGHIDDRPVVTIAGARAGKTSTVLEPNLYLYPGSMVVLDPKCELAERTASIRRALGHRVVVLDPFGQSGEEPSNFNPLAELDPDSVTIVDDVSGIAQAIVVDDGGHARHWNDSARALIQGVILFALTLPDGHGRDLVNVRQLLTLTHPHLLDVVRSRPREGGEESEEKRIAMTVLLRSMANAGRRFGGILAGIGNRFISTPVGEMGSIFSSAAAQTDFLDSLPIRAMSQSSDFRLTDLRSDCPTTIYICLPVARMEKHFRWLRLLVQLACTTLEAMGPFPRAETPVLFMLEEFATLQHMTIMERAAAYFPGFGVKLWAVLQDIGQLRQHYHDTAETFLGNAGLVQCFANNDEATLDYIARRLDKLIVPFELRIAFSRERHSQLLMFEGEPPAAASRLEHDDVAMIRNLSIEMALARRRWTDRS